MDSKLNNKVIGYHYTTIKDYKSMHNNKCQGYVTLGYEKFRGLIPSKRFIPLDELQNLPHEAYEGVIEGFLEPLPKLRRVEDILNKDLILLSFELNEQDKAYIVEKAHLANIEQQSKNEKNDSYLKYWESRVPVFDYTGKYISPQLTIWSGLDFSRLKVEWNQSNELVTKQIEPISNYYF